jgi:hypothetical protein
MSKNYLDFLKELKHLCQEYEATISASADERWFKVTLSNGQQAQFKMSALVRTYSDAPFKLWLTYRSLEEKELGLDD